MEALPRPLGQRKADTLRRLAEDVDCWVATADPDTGLPYLVPLSFAWDGEQLVLATGARTQTARNLRASPHLRLGIGPTRDVVLVEGTVTMVADTEVLPAVGDRFAARAGFDPRSLRSAYVYLLVRPVRLQAWREENELSDRDLLRDGRWLV